MIKLGPDICSDFKSSSTREWLETNGIGGYASSSVAGANTRRYHGLLVAATEPPLGRMVLLSKFEETVIVDGERFEISCNQYPGAVYPEGYKFLTRFRLDPFPVWTYTAGGVEIEKKLFMVHGENSVVVRWALARPAADAQRHVELEIKPLLAFRDHHHLRHEDAVFDGEYQTEECLVSIMPRGDAPRLNIANNAVAIEPTGARYRNFEYAIEQERGFDYLEDLYQPFSLGFDLGQGADVIVSTLQKQVAGADELEAAENGRRADVIVAAAAEDVGVAQLVLAADQFVVARGSGQTVIAGYPWFSDWGRDTMIALNGLTLATGRPEIAKSIITEFSKYLSRGMLPNRFPDAGTEPDYNTVDATLWFFEAIRGYAEATGDYVFVRDELYEKLCEVIDWHIRGTRFHIKVDTDGLLYAGEPGVQLTWMDAKIGDRVITPRTGKPVEIEALWYNALRIMEDLGKRFGDDVRSRRFFEMAEIACDSFNGQFWNEANACLFDLIDGEERDASVRPNQIFAVSLPHTMLSAEKARLVVEKVETRLLTPYGLRSLSPDDPRYAGTYIGSPEARDSAYHQGTVWGWLIGPFIDAYRRVHSTESGLDHDVAKMLAGFNTHLTEATLGQISEIFDGDAPHAPRGCGAQAWSVAEVLRVLTNVEKVVGQASLEV